MPVGGNRRHKTSPKAIQIAQRREKAIRLRLAGTRYEEIARECGYSSRGHAAADVQHALAEAIQEPAEELRALEVQRLDMLWQAAIEVLRRNHVVVNQGRIIVQDDGNPLRDDGPVLQAIDRLLKIQERRAKLLGLDAPKSFEVISSDVLDQQIRALTEELARVDEAAEHLDRDETAEAPGAETATS